jgi:cytochrome P450
MELHGRLIRPGEPITMIYASANQDLSVFLDLENFILNRKNITAHLGFGKGRRRCVGMPLARL